MSGQEQPGDVKASVRAAGGIVHRRTRHGLVRYDEIVVVHRPQYDDWTFPKGKRDGKETDAETAIREIEEETGFRGTLGRDHRCLRRVG